jgi:hypothetical protein
MASLRSGPAVLPLTFLSLAWLARRIQAHPQGCGNSTALAAQARVEAIP